MPRPSHTCERHGPGTARRLQALARLGWSSTELAKLVTGLGERDIRRLRSAPAASTTKQHEAAAVSYLYEKLWATAAPDRPHSGPGQVRKFAEREGWALPLQWDDDLGPHGIDNPDATPWPAARKTTTRKRQLPIGETVAELRHIIDDCDGATAAKRLGYSNADCLRKVLTRAGETEAARLIRKVA